MSMDSQVRGSINCHAGEKENGINQMGDLDRQRRKSSSQFECALGLMMSRRIDPCRNFLAVLSINHTFMTHISHHE